MTKQYVTFISSPSGTRSVIFVFNFATNTTKATTTQWNETDAVCLLFRVAQHCNVTHLTAGLSIYTGESVNQIYLCVVMATIVIRIRDVRVFS